MPQRHFRIKPPVTSTLAPLLLIYSPTLFPTLLACSLPVIAKLNAEARRKNDLLAELDCLNQLGPNEVELARLRREAKGRLADTRTLLRNHPTEARHSAKAL